MEQELDTTQTEQALLGQAKELDVAEDIATNRVTSQGTFTSAGLNALVDAMNTVLPLFGLPEYPRFEAEATAIPTEFAKLITMVSEAAKAAGLEEFAIELTEFKDDKSLKMAAGKLKSLAKKSEFKRFLKSERPTPAQTAAPVEEIAPIVPSPNEDEIMMSRV